MHNHSIRSACLALAVAGLLALPGSRAAAATSELDMGGLQPIADSQLAGMRGGFSFGGMDISFGVIMQTAINGVTKLMTSFNLDTPSHVDVQFTENGTPVVGTTSPLGFVLSHGPNGAFVLAKTGPNGSLSAVQQMGNMGGGLLASIQNSLNSQLIQQQVTMNIGFQNMSTIMGLRTIGVMMDRMGTSLVR